MSWRTELQRCLQASVGEELLVGEVVDRLILQVPLEQATRAWMSRFGARARGKIPAEPLRMRRYVIIQELWCYQPVWRNARRRKQPVVDGDVFSIQPIDCAWCGAPFVARRPALYCSRSCSAKSVRAAVGDKQERTALGRFA